MTPQIRSSKPVEVAPIMTEEDKKRFFSKIAFTAIEDRCWEWQGSFRGIGYGQFYLTNGGKRSSVCASRISYYLHNNIFPAEKLVLHQCDNPKCVNPKHLFLGTNKENTQDMLAKNRHIAQKGSEHHHAKLTEPQVIKIRKDFSRGVSLELLATKNNVKKACIYDVVHYRRWKHI